jgi:predicted DsbA family dithiol-disulfide isomerase
MIRIVVWSDIACPWAHLAVWRLLEARRVLGLEGRVVLDHRAFPLELVNERPTPKRILDAEIPVVGGLEPRAGWRLWQRADAEFPVTGLLALEAVQAAKAQGLEAAERLDRALRLAMFSEGRCISMRDVILDVASRCVDADALSGALDAGTARARVIEQWRSAKREGVQGSPHVFAPDGTNVHNPGIEMHWHGEHGSGFPIVDRDDRAACETLMRQAADTATVRASREAPA